ncbi:hypothetical protein HYDPIDRAFT_115067 [Hydnomerulius pinastri MD-312]|uniref:Unplaced genomic scaffold scaffold_23, whole genome shotgun sequence n=1 Tax=Hydnomerulius pinastri MD-312 TaxID=994086 RepID=A0A0C9VVR2_9AGAM|nr:hypothetical protein HYDPIDRAFT_115067 [Hydnomerulius pinastri MD-312]
MDSKETSSKAFLDRLVEHGLINAGDDLFDDPSRICPICWSFLMTCKARVAYCACINNNCQASKVIPNVEIAAEILPMYLPGLVRARYAPLVCVAR